MHVHLRQHSIISSFHELIQSRSVCRLSVRPCVCKLFLRESLLLRQNGSIATKLAHDGQQVGAHPGCAQGPDQGQRSRARGSFVLARKTLLLRGKWPDCDQTCTRWSTVSLHPRCAQGQGQGQRSRDTGTLVLDLKSLFLAGKWFDCDQTSTRWSTGEPACRVCSRPKSRSKVTWYGQFSARPKIAFSRRQMARLRPSLHTTVPRSACTQGVLKVKVKVKGHVIRALLCLT